jgi:hypothetical protein
MSSKDIHGLEKGWSIQQQQFDLSGQSILLFTLSFQFRNGFMYSTFSQLSLYFAKRNSARKVSFDMGSSDRRRGLASRHTYTKADVETVHDAKARTAAENLMVLDVWQERTLTEGLR